MSADDKTIKNKICPVDELLQDEYFIHSMIMPTPESEIYWKKAVQEGGVDVDDYELACYFLDSVKAKPQYVVNEEIYDLWERIEFENKQYLKRQKKYFYYCLSAMTGIAAIFIIAFLWYKATYDLPEEVLTISKNIEDVTPPNISNPDIQLILAEDKRVSLEGKEADIIYNENSIAINSKETGYRNEHTGQRTVYNQLIVPFGKRSMLTFAEGTKIWVNAGTRVVYPATFDKVKREIFVDGEVFLDVVPDKECPFIVKTKKHIVEVLGTSFNITAYEKDTIHNVVLVSGAVKISSPEDKTTVLSPNQLFTYTNGISTIQTVNVDEYISWKSGIYQYDSERLGVLLQRLSRYYGKEIRYTEPISQLKCSGKLDLRDDLQQILSGIARMAPIPIKYEMMGEVFVVSDY
jgi:hypothetical protein